MEPEKWRHDYDSERPTFRLLIRIRGGMEQIDRLTPGQVLQFLGIGLRVWTPEQLAALEAALRADPEPEYTPLTEAEIANSASRSPPSAPHGALVSPGGSGIFAARLPPRRHRRLPAG